MLHHGHIPYSALSKRSGVTGRLCRRRFLTAEAVLDQAERAFDYLRSTVVTNRQEPLGSGGIGGQPRRRFLATGGTLRERTTSARTQRLSSVTRCPNLRPLGELRRNCHRPPTLENRDARHSPLPRLLPRCASSMRSASEPFPATPQEERYRIGRLLPFHRRRQDLRSSAGVTRRHSSVHDDLAQLSEEKMAAIGDERIGCPLYALGQMS
jgi:hypothetical protein